MFVCMNGFMYLLYASKYLYMYECMLYACLKYFFNDLLSVLLCPRYLYTPFNLFFTLISYFPIVKFS